LRSAEKLKRETEGELVLSQGIDKATNVTGLSAGYGVLSGSPTEMMQIPSQLKANQLEIQNGQQRVKDLESQIAAYQTRLNLTPETEQELADISRGYDESKSNYDSLLQKQMQSQLATSLEQRQQGEQFRVLDPPSLPNKPSAPNHFRISLGGLDRNRCRLGFSCFSELTDACTPRKGPTQSCARSRARRYSPLEHARREQFAREDSVDGSRRCGGDGHSDCGWQPLCTLQGLNSVGMRESRLPSEPFSEATA
jgi:hypothetical protein